LVEGQLGIFHVIVRGITSGRSGLNSAHLAVQARILPFSRWVPILAETQGRFFILLRKKKFNNKVKLMILSRSKTDIQKFFKNK